MPNEQTLRAARRHHYVPRFWLKRFGQERRAGRFQVNVFDKSNGSEFTTSVDNIAVESDFNAIDDGATRLSLEEVFASIEGDAATCIARIIERRSIAGISAEEHAIICSFAALQFLRGPDLRQRFLDAARHLRERFGGDGADLPRHIADLPGENEQKVLVFRLITESLGDFAVHFAEKTLHLFSATADDKFLLGDCPIALKNDNEHGFFGNVGLAVRGIQIYVPLSPDLTLAFWCPTLLEDVRLALESGERGLRATAGYALLANPILAQSICANREKLQRSIDQIRQLENGVREGTAIPSVDDFVTHYNALQIAYAERFVIGNDFSLAARMIADNPEYRTGRRMQVG